MKIDDPGFESEPESMEWVSQYADANMVKTDFFDTLVFVIDIISTR